MNSTEEVICVTLFLVAVNGIQGQLENGVDRSLFADNLAIYITKKKLKYDN